MWPDADETQQLLARAEQGNADAMNRLLERHRAALRRVVDVRLDRKLSRRVDASDIVQDVLWEANRRLADYLADPKLPFRLWLRQLAKDRLIEMHRQHRVAQRRSLDREQQAAVSPQGDRSGLDPQALLVDNQLTPAAANIRRELAERFWLALDELDEEDREVILMRHYEHLGNGEVAQALGITPPAAGMRYLRALRRLRKVLGEDLA
jgi:RNA polymerase sigma-70 factor (ECF subfamily)